MFFSPRVAAEARSATPFRTGERGRGRAGAEGSSRLQALEFEQRWLLEATTMPTIFGRLALAAVLFCLLYVAKSEMLVVDETPCPTELPAKACLMSSGGAADRHHYNGVALPRDITVGYVQDLLQEAIKVEHGTIPLYLTTLYSINNQSSFEATTLKSVVMEEMLHMVQAANVLNAVGMIVFCF